MVDAAISGMRLAALEASTNGMEIDHRRNVVIMTGTLVWDKVNSGYVLKEGDGAEGIQCASIVCEDGSFVHLRIGIDVESIEELHATITRETQSTLSIAVMCRQTSEKLQESNIPQTKKSLQTKCRVAVTHNPVYVGTETFTMTRTASLTFPVPDVGDKKQVIIAGPP